MAIVVNKKRAMLSLSFTKQLAIADINLTLSFFEVVKHNWGLFLVLEILEEKFDCVVVSNVDIEVRL